MKKLFLAVMLISVMVSSAAFAENTASVGKGNWLVGAGLDLGHVWGGGYGQTTFTGQADVGYFLYDFLMPELAFKGMVTNGADAELFTAGARLYYNKGKPWLPYVKLGLGVGSVNWGSRATAFALNPAIGIDYLLNTHVSIGAQISYTAYIRSGTYNEINFPIGFSIYF